MRVLAGVERIHAEECIFTSQGCSKRESYADRGASVYEGHMTIRIAKLEEGNST